MATIQPLVTRAIADGRITSRELQGMLNTVKADGAIDAAEKAELVEILDLYEPLFSVFDVNERGQTIVVQTEPQRLEMMDLAGLSGTVMPTAQNLEGPYFYPNAPVRTDGVISPAGAEGTPLTVTGTVRDTSGNIIPNAKIEIWQADPNGVYSDFENGRRVRNPGYEYRGAVLSGDAGNYRFDSLLPGSYGGRPKHIHIKITAEGYSPLTTQLYFKGDELNPGDPFIIPSLIMDTETDASGAVSADFGFVLRPLND
jgi:protocatechuate 3,4-dioxygenase beta subunit